MNGTKKPSWTDFSNDNIIPARALIMSTTFTIIPLCLLVFGRKRLNMIKRKENISLNIVNIYQNKFAQLWLLIMILQNLNGSIFNVLKILGVLDDLLISKVLSVLFVVFYSIRILLYLVLIILQAYEWFCFIHLMKSEENNQVEQLMLRYKNVEKRT